MIPLRAIQKYLRCAAWLILVLTVAARAPRALAAGQPWWSAVSLLAGYFGKEAHHDRLPTAQLR